MKNAGITPIIISPLGFLSCIVGECNSYQYNFTLGSFPSSNIKIYLLHQYTYSRLLSESVYISCPPFKGQNFYYLRKNNKILTTENDQIPISKMYS